MLEEACVSAVYVMLEKIGQGSFLTDVRFFVSWMRGRLLEVAILSGIESFEKMVTFAYPLVRDFRCNISCVRPLSYCEIICAVLCFEGRFCLIHYFYSRRDI